MICAQVIECLGVILSAWFSYSIAHFGPKVEPQLAWAITVTLASLYQPNMVEATTVGAITGMSSHRHPEVVPDYGWMALVAIFASALWLAARHWKIAEGNGGRYGTVAFIATNIVVVVIMIPAGIVPWKRFSAGLGHWHSMVRIGLTLRYLASSVAAAVLTRMTKIATGHPSATAGAMSALLITLLVLAILNTKGEWVYDVTQAVTMGAFVGMSDANVLISSRVPLAGVIAVGYRLLTAPFCEGFAGIEAFCAFLAVATHRVCQPRQESLFERNAAG